MRSFRGRAGRSLSVEHLERRFYLSAAPASLIGAAAAHHSSDNDAPVLVQAAAATPTTISTVPANGDVNPYGLAIVPQNFAPGGMLQPGDILVSNFNNSGNLQGTGTTISRITPAGQTSTFFQGGAGLGLTTALGVLDRGFVLVGNVPTTDGTSATVQSGSLMILDKNGAVVANLTDSTLLDGPWDLTVNDHGNTAQVFVSNVLSGAITRIDLRVTNHGTNVAVESMTQIASGYAHRTDPAALVVGPTGLVYDARSDVLYVASTGDNAVFAIDHASRTAHDAGMGRLVYQDNAHLRGPLAMVQDPNGDLIVSNGDAVNPDPAQTSELVEFTPRGKFVTQFSLDPAAGAAFGLALANRGDRTEFVAVNDDTNTIEIFNVDRPEPRDADRPANLNVPTSDAGSQAATGGGGSSPHASIAGVRKLDSHSPGGD